MANLNTDLLSPEQAIEATVAAYNSKDAIEKIEGLEASAREINEGTKSLSFKRGQVIEPFTTSDGITVIDTLASVQFQVLNESTPCGDTCLEIKTTVPGKHLMFEKAIKPISLVQAKTLSFYVATDNPANFGNAAIGLAYSKNNNRNTRFEVSFKPVLQSSRWYQVKVNISELIKQNNIVITDVIDYIYFIAYPSAGLNSYFKLGGLELDVEERPAISFTFDDGQLTDYTVGYEKMKQYGFKGTIFQISEAVGLSQRTTLAQIKEMHNAGWKFGIHGKDALNWTTEQTATQAEASIKTCRDYLYNNGLTGLGLKACAYPQGQHNDATIESLRKLGIPYCRSSYLGINYYPLVDPNRIKGIAISNNLAAHKLEVDNVIKRGGHLVYVIHVLSGDLETTFNSLIDYIGENYPEYVTTLPEWYEMYSKLEK